MLDEKKEGTTSTEGAPADNSQSNSNFTMDDVKKLIQSETDKVRTEYSKKLKASESELEKLKQAKMTDDEKAKYELDLKTKEILEKERLLYDKELELKKVDLMKDNALPLDFKKFIAGKDENEISNNLQDFKKLWDTALQSAVEKKFKDGGREVKGTEKTNVNELDVLRSQHSEALKAGRMKDAVSLNSRIWELSQKSIN